MTRGLDLAIPAGAAALCLLCGLAASYEIKAVTPPSIMSESPFWDDTTNTVIYVDIIGKEVLRYDPANGEVKSISFSNHTGRVSPAVPVGSSSRILVGVGLSVYLVDVDWGAQGVAAVMKSSQRMAQVEQDLPGNRFNDGKADRAGRLWIGTMDDSQTSRRRRRRAAAGKPNKGELFRFDLHRHETRGHTVETTCAVAHDLAIPNGMAWTADNQGYYLADSSARAIYRYDYDHKLGTIANRTDAFRFDDAGVPGAPDGLTIDVDGNLWVACVHGGRVIRVDPRTGKLLLTIKMNVTNPSAAEWGGADRDVLYVTSARYRMDAAQLAEEPEAGCMFAITGLGTRGQTDVPFPAKSRTEPDAEDSTETTAGSRGLSGSWMGPLLMLLLSTFSSGLH